MASVERALRGLARTSDKIATSLSGGFNFEQRQLIRAVEKIDKAFWQQDTLGVREARDLIDDLETVSPDEISPREYYKYLQARRIFPGPNQKFMGKKFTKEECQWRPWGEGWIFSPPKELQDYRAFQGFTAPNIQPA